MLTRRTASGALALTLALGAAACSDDGNEVTAPSFDTTPAPLTAAPTTDAVTTTTQAPATSTIAPSTTSTAVVETTVASTVADGLTGPMFSDALGVKVDTAPGVTTRGDTRQLLPEGLYVHLAWEADPNDPSVFTPQPDDVEILEAYANAVRVFYEAALTTVTIDADVFGEFFIDSGAQYAATFEEARAGGYVAALGSGVVLRPYVLADERSAESATVLDCYLQDEEFVLAGSSKDPGPLETKGTIATMTKVADRWKVDIIATELRACV